MPSGAEPPAAERLPRRRLAARPGAIPAARGRGTGGRERGHQRRQLRRRRGLPSREVLGEETAAICRDEGITQSNCWVMLHRARIALRMCLEQNWFGAEASRGR